ncbi:MAG: hypothetical protein QXO55_05200 [Candidatus Korarchaeum sp.]
MSRERILKRFFEVLPECMDLGLSLSLALLVSPYLSLVGVMGDAVFDWMKERIGDKLASKLKRKLRASDDVKKILNEIRRDPEVKEMFLKILSEFLVAEITSLPSNLTANYFEISTRIKGGLIDLKKEFPNYSDSLSSILERIENLEKILLEESYIKGIHYIKVTVGKEEHVESAPFVIGRYDPEVDSSPEELKGPEDCLAIKKENVRRLFRNTVCRYGCKEEEYDCTHRRHVEVTMIAGEIFIRNIGKNPVILLKNGDEIKIDFKGAPIGEKAIIYVSGVYMAHGGIKAQISLELVKGMGRTTFQ